MPQNVKVKLNGKQVKAKSRAGGIKGLHKGVEYLKEVSSNLAPHEEGILQDSAVASVEEAELKGAVSFDTPYSVIQHERLDYKHDEDRQAKYLEEPMLTKKDTILDLVATEIRRALR